MAGPQLTLKCRWGDEGVLVVDAAGEFDASSAPLLCEPLARFIHAGQSHFVVDFGGVRHVDHSAVHDLDSLNRTVRTRGGTLFFTGGPELRAALRAGGIDDTTLVFDTVESAVEAGTDVVT